MTVNLSRRSLLQSVSLAATMPAMPVFAKVAPQDANKTWTGYACCDSCNHGPFCGIQFQARGNMIERIENWKENPNHFLCSKGWATLQRQYNPNRLLYPMKRTNPKSATDPGWVRITWDEAYRTIAAKMLEAREKYGPHRVMFYAGDPKEPRAPIQRLARYFGSTTWGTESSVACRSGCAFGEALNFGVENIGSAPGPKTKVFIVLATNAWARPIGWWNMLLKAKARGVKIICIDPRRTKAAQIADIHLQLKVGTDTALAAGMTRVLIKENLYNKAFVEQWTHGFKEYAAYCEKFTPEYTESITGVPAKLIVDAARMWADGPGTYISSPQSLSHNSNGIANTRAPMLLTATMGYIDVEGGLPFNVGPKKLLHHAFGQHEDFIDYNWWFAPEQLAQCLDREDVPIWSATHDQVSPNNFPEWVKAGKVKVFCGWGFNVNIWPQPAVYREAFRQLDFAFAVDYFHRPDSHDMLDMILPAATNYERYAPFGNYGPRLIARRPVKPLGEAKEDWRIALELGCIVDKPERFFEGDPVKALDWILKQYPDRSYEKLDAALPNPLPLPGAIKGFMKFEKGLLRPDGKPGFNTKSGKIEYVSETLRQYGHSGLPEYKPMMPLTDEFNLRFINGTRKPHITHSKTRNDQPYLMEIENGLHIDMNPKDAAARNLKEGDVVEIRSPFGGPVRATLTVSIIVPEGTIGGQYGWLGDMNTQVLVPRDHRDPITGYPCYFEVPVSVTKKA